MGLPADLVPVTYRRDPFAPSPTESNEVLEQLRIQCTSLVLIRVWAAPQEFTLSIKKKKGAALARDYTVIKYA